MIMIQTMIDGSLLLYAFARDGKGDKRPACSCFRAGSDWSTPLLTPFAPATWSDRSLLILTFFFPSHLPSSLHLCTLASVHFSFQPFCQPFTSLSLPLACLPFPSPVTFFSSTFASSHTVFPFVFLHPFLPFYPFYASGSDFQARDLTAVSYLLRARILFGAPFNYLVRNSNEEEQLLY